MWAVISIISRWGWAENCTIFDNARKWAYVAIRTYRGFRSSAAFLAWGKEVLLKCSSLNGDFKDPLSFGELKHIAKSIAKWTWQNDPKAEQDFLKRQSIKGKKGGEKSGQVSLNASVERRKQATDLYFKNGGSARQVALEIGLSIRSVQRWILEERKMRHEA